jgi:diaminopimelate decarboxylase
MDKIQFDYRKFNELENEFGSSYYLFNVSKLRENYKKIEQAFKSKYENFIIGYSYKTNYLPYLCKELSKLGAYAEVVSRLEYDLAIKIGEDPIKIIFNGPLKSKDDLDYALSNGSIINLDSIYEIDFVKEYALNNQNSQIRIGLRLNFDISENGVSALQEGYEVSRFGICVENGNLENALHALRDVKNIKIAGLHGHFSTRNREVESYRRITQKLCEIAKKYILDSLEYLDIGGGIYGELPKSFAANTPPTFNDYAEAVCKIMNTEFDGGDKKPALILEPGISMVANTFSFVAKVIESKKVRKQNFVLVDGSVHNIKPTMHKKNLPMKIVNKNESRKHGTYNIVGYTCMEKDYLAHEIQGEIPEKDDYVVFENVGAYTIVFNPPFIKERPSIVTIDGEKVFVVRKKETLREFFNEDLYVF